MRQLGYQAGERVTVVGLGVIGLCTVAVAQAMGARVSAIANSPFRRDLALRVGAEHACLAGEGEQSGIEADLIVLTANTWDAYRESVDIARYGGGIGVLGFPGRAQPDPGFNPLAMEWFYGKQLILAGSGFSPRAEVPPQEIAFNVRRNIELIFDYARRGKLPLDRIITHRFPAHQLVDAYEFSLDALQANGRRHLRLALGPPHSAPTEASRYRRPWKGSPPGYSFAPPLTAITCPVIQRPSGPASAATVSATSSAFPTRGIACTSASPPPVPAPSAATHWRPYQSPPAPPRSP
jgi:hypothetical protein